VGVMHDNFIIEIYRKNKIERIFIGNYRIIPSESLAKFIIIFVFNSVDLPKNLVMLELLECGIKFERFIIPFMHDLLLFSIKIFLLNLFFVLFQYKKDQADALR
jgi:hypothetical protein